MWVATKSLRKTGTDRVKRGIAEMLRCLSGLASGLAGNVASVDTTGYWRDESESPKGQGFHYNHNAETYMLAGDGGASNIDPYAAGPTDDNDWVQEGPHMMLEIGSASRRERV